MTPFLSMHPGGIKTLLESAGTVADARFDETHGGPHAQEIRGYLQSLAIGRLSTATTESSACNTQTVVPSAVTQTTAEKLLEVLVRMQNALTNNTSFAEDRRPVPMFVYADALLVCTDGLDGIVGIVSDLTAENHLSEMRDIVMQTQVLLRQGFAALKEGCKGCLAAAGSDPLLNESEKLIWKLYELPIRSMHAAINACKKGIGEIASKSASDGTQDICDAYNDEQDNALVYTIGEFCRHLNSVADGLLC